MLSAEQRWLGSNSWSCWLGSSSGTWSAGRLQACAQGHTGRRALLTAAATWPAIAKAQMPAH